MLEKLQAQINQLWTVIGTKMRYIRNRLFPQDESDTERTE
ncbi:MAG: hypothetical protein A07HR67_02835 [uncultured archaeon A07HR67]|nr:MAG: hypothetical protein A07HR67_02835 [uncultured archaeon A07HR67]